eukprot:7377463-Prymnesium_polylepis.2
MRQSSRESSVIAQRRLEAVAFPMLPRWSTKWSGAPAAHRGILPDGLPESSQAFGADAVAVQRHAPHDAALPERLRERRRARVANVVARKVYLPKRRVGHLGRREVHERVRERLCAAVADLVARALEHHERAVLVQRLRERLGADVADCRCGGSGRRQGVISLQLDAWVGQHTRVTGTSRAIDGGDARVRRLRGAGRARTLVVAELEARDGAVCLQRVGERRCPGASDPLPREPHRSHARVVHERIRQFGRAIVVDARHDPCRVLSVHATEVQRCEPRIITPQLFEDELVDGCRWLSLWRDELLFRRSVLLFVLGLLPAESHRAARQQSGLSSGSLSQPPCGSHGHLKFAYS